MKTYQYLFGLFLFILGLASCYEDESSLNYKLINPIVIDLGDNGQYSSNTPTYTLFSMDTLEIKPIVYKEGEIDNNLTCTWTIQGNNIAPKVIGNCMTLCACIDVPAEGNAYQMVLDVEDQITGIHAQQLFNVQVESPFGIGLLVADSKDGQNSDVSLIMSYHFTNGLRLDQTRNSHDLFSQVNGRKITSYPVNGLLASTYGVNRSLTITTPGSIDRVDPFNFSFMDSNRDVFVIDPKQYNPSKLGYIGNQGVELMLMDGKLYPRTMQQSNKYFAFYLLTKDMSDYYITNFFCPHWEDGLAFDAKNGRLLQLNGTGNLLLFASDKLEADAPFDQNKLQDFTCKAMMYGNNSTFHSILQNKKDGKIYSYVTKRQAYYNGPDNGKPVQILDLSTCPDIADAVGFAAVETQPVIYYATRNKIYSVYYRGNDLTVTPEYTAPANNEISLLLSWHEYTASGKIDYTNPNTSAEQKVISTYNKNRMLVIATHDTQKNEGFVRTIAIATVGTGTLEKDYKNHGEYGGFGRITAIAPKMN